MPFITVEEEEKTARWEPLGQWIGIKKEWFPPICRLTEDQTSRIMNALSRCLYAFGFIPHFPSGLPVSKQYEVAVDYLLQRVPILVYNTYQLDFCGYEPRSCPFGSKFCQCKVYERWLTRLNEEDDDLLDNISSAEPLPPFSLDDPSGYYDEDEYLDYEDDLWEDEDDDEFFSDFDLDFGPDGGRLN
jgi:hypothetical protein